MFPDFSLQTSFSNRTTAMLRAITRQMLTSGHKVAAGSHRVAASPFVGSQRAYSVSPIDPNDPDDNASFFEMVTLFYDKGKSCAVITWLNCRMILVCDALHSIYIQCNTKLPTQNIRKEYKKLITMSNSRSSL